MRKFTATVGSLVASAALIGATATVTSAHEDRATRTLHFVDKTMRGAESQTGRNTFASAGVDKVHGRVVGYSALTATFNAKTQKARVNVAVALKGGILVLGVTQGEHSGARVHGRVLTGTGKFRGASGSFTATQTSETRTVVTVRYTVHS